MSILGFPCASRKSIAELHIGGYRLLMTFGECESMLLNLDNLRQAKLETDPFPYTIVPEFLHRNTLNSINDTFPPITSGGSFDVRNLQADMTVKTVIDELDQPDFQKVIEDKFGVDLADKPKMYSLRGYTRAKDGKIHTDSKEKIITVLLYFNLDWQPSEGRLRLLRDGKNLDNYVAEVASDNGMLLVFKRSDNSWHGHFPFEGQRRALQMNWMTGSGWIGWHQMRHALSAIVKKRMANG